MRNKPKNKTCKIHQIMELKKRVQVHCYSPMGIAFTNMHITCLYIGLVYKVNFYKINVKLTGYINICLSFKELKRTLMK